MLTARLRAEAADLERRGELAAALAAYEQALAAAPDDAAVQADLAALAGRMGMHEVALAFWSRLAERPAFQVAAADGRGQALRDLGRYDDAIEVLRPALEAHPHTGGLWNTLGTVLLHQGDARTAATFFDEAVRLDPRSAAARYNRGGVRFDLGDLDGAQADFSAARAIARAPREAATIAFAEATLKLCRGDLAAGWDAYEARLSPDLPGGPVFEAPGQRWTPQTPLDGARLLVLAEQGLGDEIMFAEALSDVLAALGPEGRLSLAVDPRLTGLFARSFPGVEVSVHHTRVENGRKHRGAPALARPQDVDLWAPMASLPARFRRSLDDFAGRAGYLTPDPARVEHWRAWLGDGPPAVGLSWRSGKLAGERRRQYPAREDWAPVLRAAPARLVAIQYDADAREIAALSDLAGAALLQPPGIDLRNDIDDLAALCVALDLVVSAANATAALAAACGAQTWFLTAPAAWPRLGTDGYPWYGAARSFPAPAFGAWQAPVADIAAGIAALAR